MQQGTCAHCSKPFEVRDPRQRYCSVPCRSRAGYLRTERARFPTSSIYHHACPCGKSFVAHGSNGPNRVFCSRACALKAHHERCKADGRRAAMKAKQNADPKYQEYQREYHARWYRENIDQVRATDARRGRRSRALTKARRSAAGSAGPGTFVAGFCRECGAGFVARRPGSFCSLACSRRSLGRISGKDKKWRRHAAAVYARDGHVCHLCGRPTDPAQVVPHPDAPTLDHVIPRSSGGTHDPSNLRCAHFSCNCQRGATPLREWRSLARHLAA